MRQKGLVVRRTELKRYLLIAAGFAFVGIGAIGVVVPLLPTTPFLLLAAYCFLRGSERWHAWLMGNRVLGRYIHDYVTYRTVPLRTKLFALTVLWVSIGVSIWIVWTWYITLILLAIAGGVTLHILRLGTTRRH